MGSPGTKECANKPPVDVTTIMNIQKAHDASDTKAEHTCLSTNKQMLGAFVKVEGIVTAVGAHKASYEAE